MWHTPLFQHTKLAYENRLLAAIIILFLYITSPSQYLERMKKGAAEILLHVAGSLTFLAIPLLFRPGAMDSFDVFDDPRSRSDFFTYLLLIGFFYLNYGWLIPELYFKNKYAFFGLTVLASLLVISTVPDFVFPSGIHHDHPFPPPPKPRGAPMLMFKTGNVFLLFLLVFFLSVMLKISMRWRQTEKEKLNAELAYLKAQINPHFLFNTLNSIFS